MSEYIVEMPKEPAKVVRDGWNVRIEWQYKQREEIVRCRDCRYYDPNDEPSNVYPDRYWCDLMANYLHPDGFCAWGERANFATCKCGEDIDLGERESAVCPRCNRTVRA